ncbi:PREDICTED: uncharacterized protein LOC108974720 [Bactrocera latifrons]|uniref:uncharacterized protein LOC108974720 n=1 Tax=Bactrocera latifrons TaxID=174628 RepID=UPI0008DCD203|nr:PREDICTED: uncharacterized protein LOC108974720 [Bactrocera latifrons]
MDKKLQKNYGDIFSYINENVFELSAKSFLTDFEVILQMAIRNKLTVGKIYGCWFHYCQAIRRNISYKWKQLASSIRNNQNASTIYHKILALPLLPATQISAAFGNIKEELVNTNMQELFTPFITYYEKQWLRKVTPEVFSVFLKRTQTTSAVDSYKGVIGRMIQKNGNLLKLLLMKIEKWKFFQIY